MKQDEIGRSVLAAFARVPDPRSRHGRRHPLPAVLALATAAMLSGARSLYAMAQWGRLQPVEVVQAVGFTRTRTPAVAMLHDPFKAVDVAACEAALHAWVLRVLGPPPRPATPAWRAAALDGKALRGLHGEEVPGVRLVAVYDGEAGLGDRRKRGVRTTTETATPTEAGKQEAEVGVAPTLLRRAVVRRAGGAPGGW
jgi:hypothetical protein